jgi:hypothetical protein
MFYVFEGGGAKLEKNVESEASPPSANPLPKKNRKNNRTLPKKLEQ